MATDISKLGVKTKWQDLTEGMIVAGAGTSKDFHTGEWTSVKPEFIEDKCKQCLLCVPVCPDSCIPVKDILNPWSLIIISCCNHFVYAVCRYV